MSKRKIKRQAEVAWQKHDQRLVVAKTHPDVEIFPSPPFPDPAGPRPEDWRFFDPWYREAVVEAALRRGRV